MNTALILVDIQKDYFPQGRMELVGSVDASQKAGRLLACFRKENLPIIHIQHISARKGATFFLPDTDGILFHDNVRPAAGETVIEKHFPNSFRDTNLKKVLDTQNIDELVVCGMMSHMCIDATVRAAFDDGYACLVAHDACATRSVVFNGRDIPAEHVHGSFMAALAAVYAGVQSTEQILALLKERSST